MKLVAFRVEGFRCLYDTDWIPVFDLTFFTGQNDGGKSSTLAALHLFLNERAMPSADDYSFVDPASTNDERVETMMLAAQFSLSENECAALQAGGIDDTTEPLTVFRRFCQDDPSAAYLFRTQAHADTRFHRDLNSYTKEQLLALGAEFDVPLNKASLKADLVATVQTWLATQPRVEAEILLPDSLRSRLPVMQIFSSESALDPEQEIKRVLSTQYKELLKDENISGRIDDVTEEINTRLNAGLVQLVPVIQRYCGDIQDVTIRPDFNFANGLSTTNMQLLRRNGPVLLDRSGAGQRRRISLAIYEWQLELLEERDEDSQQLILAFDEPDTHLDYSSQRQIFDLIERFAKSPAVQVLVTTHSLNMIERVPIQNIVHFRLNDLRQSACQVFSPPRTEDGVTEHELIDLFMYRISENMGLRNSIMLHERCFLVVEGITEVAALPVLFHLRYDMPLQSAGICLINGKNQVGARQLTTFLHTHGRNVLFLVDEDAKTDTSARRYFRQQTLAEDGIDITTQVHFVGANEFEDAFSNDVWVRMLNTHYARREEGVWAEDEIEACRAAAKFSNSIQGELYKAFGYRPSKSDLGYRLAKAIELVDEIPPAILRCFEAAYRISNP